MHKILAPLMAALVSTAVVMPAKAETLLDAMAMAYQTNPVLLAQRAALRATDEGVSRATAGFLPSVTGTGQIARQNVAASSVSAFGEASSNVSSTPKFYQARIDQSIFAGLQTISGRKQAKSQVMAGRAQLASIEQIVFLDTATAFMDVLRDEAVLRLNQNNVEVLQRQLEASEDRFRVGEITRTDVAQSQAALAGAISDRIGSAGNLAASRSRYREVVGQQSGTLEKPPTPPGIPATLEEALEIGTAQSPFIEIARHNEEAARHAVKRAMGVLAPTVDGFVTISRFTGTSAFGAETVDVGSTTKTVGVAIRIPLFQGGGEYSDIRAARQLNSQRRLEIISVDRNVRQVARTSWESYVASQAQIISTEAQVEANAIALEGVRQEASVGSRTTLDVLDAEQLLLDSRVNLVRAERNEYVAAFVLLAAVGRLDAQDFELPVEVYDPTVNYDKVKNKFFGWDVFDD